MWTVLFISWFFVWMKSQTARSWLWAMRSWMCRWTTTASTMMLNCKRTRFTHRSPALIATCLDSSFFSSTTLKFWTRHVCILKINMSWNFWFLSVTLVTFKHKIIQNKLFSKYFIKINSAAVQTNRTLKRNIEVGCLGNQNKKE
jgi:hypothetical protein